MTREQDHTKKIDVNAADAHQELTSPIGSMAFAKQDSSQHEVIQRKSKNFWQDAAYQIYKNKLALAGLIVMILLGIMAWVGPLMNDHSFHAQNLDHKNLPPKVHALADIPFSPFDGLNKDGVDVYETRDIKEAYWFGTDNLGRDLWTRVWKGTQISVIIGLAASLIDLIIGVIYGSISGYVGGRVDTIMQRIVEILSSIPYLILVILLIVVMDAGLFTIIFALAVLGWLGMSRIVRGQFLKLKNEEFVMASRTLGASKGRLIFRHILPNTLGPIIVTLMFSIPGAIFSEAFLSFIGLGIPAPNASLGSLINDGRKVLLLHPYQLMIPSLVLSVLILSFYLFGDGLRDAFDPKMRD